MLEFPLMMDVSWALSSEIVVYLTWHYRQFVTSYNLILSLRSSVFLLRYCIPFEVVHLCGILKMNFTLDTCILIVSLVC